MKLLVIFYILLTALTVIAQPMYPGPADAEMTSSFLIEKQIEANQIVVFSSMECAECVEVNTILNAKSIKFNSLPLMTSGNSFMHDMHKYLIKKCGKSDLPVIYVNGNFLGGLSELNTAIDNGDLAKMLAAEYPPKADI